MIPDSDLKKLINNRLNNIENAILDITIHSVNYRNTSYYAKHLNRPLWYSIPCLKNNKTPYFIKSFANEIQEYILNNKLDFIDMYYFLKEYDQVYTNYLLTMQFHYGINRLIDCDKMSIREFSVFFSFFIIDCFPYDNDNFDMLVLEETFNYKITDNKLTKMEEVEFKQLGYIYKEDYYLYSYFINKEPLENHRNIPAIFGLISNHPDFNKADFFMRVDSRLGIPKSEINDMKFVEMDRYYGVTFKFSTTNLSKMKEHIVYINPDTGNKLLLVIKKRFDDIKDVDFWHIELETLPCMQGKNVNLVTTTFVHGQYYPNNRMFNHIDFTKNQYSINDYNEKFLGKEKSIDFYTATKQSHYKIWCIENIDMTEEFWCKIVCLSLTSEYEKLFKEILENN